MGLLKKFKKLNIYIRVLMVYTIFLIIKWCCWKTMGVEVGVSKEGINESDVSTLPDESEQRKKRKRLWDFFSWPSWMPEPPRRPALGDVNF